MIKIMGQGTIIDKKIMRQGIMQKGIFIVLLKQWIMFNFGKIFYATGYTFGAFLCDMV